MGKTKPIKLFGIELSYAQALITGLIIIGAVGVYTGAIPILIGSEEEETEGIHEILGTVKCKVTEYLDPATAITSGTVYFVHQDDAGVVSNNWDSATIGSDGTATSTMKARSGEKIALWLSSTNYYDYCTDWIVVPKSDSEDAGQTHELGTYKMIKKASTPTMTMVDDMGHTIFNDTVTQEYDVDSASYTSSTDTFYWTMITSQTTANTGMLNWWWTDLKTDSDLLVERGSYYALKIFSTTATDEYASDMVIDLPGATEYQTGTNEYWYIVPLTNDQDYGWRDLDDNSNVKTGYSGSVTFPFAKLDCSSYNGGAGYNQGVTVDAYVITDGAISYFLKYESWNSGATTYHISDSTDVIYIGDSDTAT